MSFDEHTQAEFQRLMASEENVLEAITQMEEEVRRNLVDVLVLMAIYDGELADKEREFLMNTAERLNVPLDIDEAEQRTQDYQIVIKKNILERTAGVAGGAAVKAIGVAGQAAGSVKDTAVGAGGKVKDAFGKVLKRKKSIITCSNCGREVPAEYQFCPGCGQATATEKTCVSCGELIPIDFAFCPHCGASQS